MSTTTKSRRRTTKSPTDTLKLPRRATRVERDSMGSMTVPGHVLYGATTQRAVINFPIAKRPVPGSVIQAFAFLKQSCSETNVELKKLDAKRGKLVAQACDVILAAADGESNVLSQRGEWMDHFPVDVFQTGSGTSTNMNVNEVVSNLACMLAGEKIGAKDPVHPNDHVNMGQSSNDTFPTAMQVAAAIAIQNVLLPALSRMEKTLKAKSRKWNRIVKIGRTHLMDATPIRLGQEFSGYAAQLGFAVRRAQAALKAIAENLPIGGTAVGTGMNTDPSFGNKVAARLAKKTGIAFREARNHFEAQATRDCIVDASGHLRTIAVSLSKIANDIRWLGSGPRCGLYELALPATQPGSSIMPGKVNPVMCESIMQVACQVVGNDAAIAMGGAGGVGSLLELNVAMPMMADNLLDSIELLGRGVDAFCDRCLDELEVNESIATGTVEKSLMLCTALAPEIGYDRAAKVAKEALVTGETVRENVLRHELVDPKRLDNLLDASSMT